MNNFNIEEFKKEYEFGDLSGLEYLEKTIIKNMKEINSKNNTIFFTKEDYLINLFYATLSLNYCNNIYETDYKENGKNFNYDLYFQTKDLLFTELEKYLNLDFGELENE